MPLFDKVLVANPRKTRLIYGQGRKTDKLDAERIAVREAS